MRRSRAGRSVLRRVLHAAAPRGRIIPTISTVTGRVIFLILLTGGMSGCASPPKGFDSPVPAYRMDAAVDAAREGDRSAIPDLIGLLDSDDSLVRMVAIRSLERLTGQTLGYDHAASEWRRDEAVERWVAWALAEAEAGSRRSPDAAAAEPDHSGAPSSR